MKAFSSEQVKELNSKAKTGRFVEAVVFVRDQDSPDVKDYFINYRRPVIFQGNTYRPVNMAWDGIVITSQMELPTNKVVVASLGEESILDYLEDPNIVIEGNDVFLQVLFINKWGKISLVEQMLFQVEIVLADYYLSATFHLGVNWSLGDIVPRQTMEKREFPGLRDDVIRVGT